MDAVFSLSGMTMSATSVAPGGTTIPSARRMSINWPAALSPGAANRQTALKHPCGHLDPPGPLSETGLGLGVRAEQGDDARAEEPRMLRAEMAPQMAETGHARPPAHLAKL